MSTLVTQKKMLKLQVLQKIFRSNKHPKPFPVQKFVLKPSNYTSYRFPHKRLEYSHTHREPGPIWRRGCVNGVAVTRKNEGGNDQSNGKQQLQSTNYNGSDWMAFSHSHLGYWFSFLSSRLTIGKDTLVRLLEYEIGSLRCPDALEFFFFLWTRDRDKKRNRDWLKSVKPSRTLNV